MKIYKKIVIVAGESSGDQHAANYVKLHKIINPKITFSAIGQQELKKTIPRIIFDSEIISVVGITEVISKYSKIRYALNLAKSHMKDSKPDLVVLVDYVEFNLKVAEYAKELGIPVLFYIAPQVWAWRKKRIKKIINLVDQLAVVFKFEEKLFSQYTDKVTYVGHPLAEKSYLKPSEIDYNLRKTDLGIFPGSRQSEIKNNLHCMLDCIKISNNESILNKNIKIFYSNNTAKEYISKLLPKGWEILLASGKDIDEIKNCKKALTASGTITLELAMMNIPMIVVYRLSTITYFIMKHLVKIKYIGLVNLILGKYLGEKPLVKEFIQPDYTDIIQIMLELQRIDNDVNYRENIESNYSEIRNILQPGASKNVAEIAEKLLK